MSEHKAKLEKSDKTVKSSKNSKNSKKSRSSRDGPQINGGSRQARKTATAVLEVLAGVISPSEASSGLGISMPRYYHIERRALEGLVGGCEPLAKGRRSTGPEKIIERLERRCKTLQRDLARYQALARAAGRTAGVAGPKKTSTGKRKRRPSVRALKIARGLKKDVESTCSD